MASSSKSPTNATNPLPSLFDYTLRATRFRLRLVDVGAAGLLMLALGVAGTLAIVAADHFISGGLSLWTRWTLRWILIGAEAVLLIAMIALPLLRRISNLYAARQMEKADPSFHNDLTAAVQLQGQAGPAAATAAAVRRSAAKQVARMSNGAPMQKRSLKLAALAAAAAMAAFCLYWVFAPKSTVTSLQRAMGLGDPPAPTRTQILSFTPDDDTTVLTGDEVSFDARLRFPQGPAVLQIARDAHTILDEDVLTMAPVDEPGPGEAYRATWKAISAAGWAKFRLTCGDAESPWRRIQVLPTPALRRVQVECDWPKYTHLPPQVSEGGRVEGPVGTQATITAEVNLPVKQATLEFEADGRTLVMEPDESGKFLSTTFRVDKPGRYVIRYKLRDIDAEAKSIPHEVVVTPDHPPTLRLDQSAGDTTLAENESLNVQGEVTDDFGVGRVELVCTTKDGKTKTHPILRAKAPGASSRRLQSSIKAGSLGRAGETLTCVVQARDLNPSVAGGQVARSKPFTLTITPPQTTAEQKETAGGQGLPHEAGDVPMGQAEDDESQPAATGAEMESQNAQAEAGETSEESGEQQSGDQQSPAKQDKETQSQQVASNGNGQENQTDSGDAKKLDQLCKAMQKEERQTPQDNASGESKLDNQSETNGKKENDSESSGEKQKDNQGLKQDGDMKAKGEIPPVNTSEQKKEEQPESTEKKSAEVKPEEGIKPKKMKNVSSKYPQSESADEIKAKKIKITNPPEAKGVPKEKNPTKTKKIVRNKTEQKKKAKGMGQEPPPIKKKAANRDKIPIKRIGPKKEIQKKEISVNMPINPSKKGFVGTGPGQKSLTNSSGKSSTPKSSKGGKASPTGKENSQQPATDSPKETSNQPLPKNPPKEVSKKQEKETSSAETKKNQNQKAKNPQEEKQQPDSKAKNTNKTSKSNANSNASQQDSADDQTQASKQPGQGQPQGQQQASQAGESLQTQEGAQTVHENMGKGAGMQDREGDLEDLDDKALMPGTTQPLKSVGEALDKARRQIDNGKIDPKLLEAMNMTAPQFKAFVEKYTREYNKALQKNREAKETVKAKQSIDDDVQKGDQNKAGNVTGDNAIEKQRAKEDRETTPGEVSPEYRKQLEAYLRAVSEGEEK